MKYLTRPSAEYCPQCSHLGAFERSFCPVQHPPRVMLGALGVQGTTGPEQARRCLYMALLQSCAADDRILREYMRAAFEALGGDLADLDARNPGAAL